MPEGNLDTFIREHDKPGKARGEGASLSSLMQKNLYNSLRITPDAPRVIEQKKTQGRMEGGKIFEAGNIMVDDVKDTVFGLGIDGLINKDNLITEQHYLPEDPNDERPLYLILKNGLQDNITYEYIASGRHGKKGGEGITIINRIVDNTVTPTGLQEEAKELKDIKEQLLLIRFDGAWCLPLVGEYDEERDIYINDLKAFFTPVDAVSSFPKIDVNSLNSRGTSLPIPLV